MEKKFGDALRQLRNSKGLSQEDLAVCLDISRSHIGRLETGEKQPSLKMLFRLADALEVPASAIVAEMEKGRQGNCPPDLKPCLPM
jgi:transcriptional regulator with XRE-family HTH domain